MRARRGGRNGQVLPILRATEGAQLNFSWSTSTARLTSTGSLQSAIPGLRPVPF